MGTGTYTITLAAGPQGRATISALLALGHQVHAVVRNRNSALAQDLAQVYPTVRICEAPFEDTSSLREAMDGTDGVFINLPPPQRNDETYDLRLMQNVLAAAKDAKTVKTAVFASALHSPEHQQRVEKNPNYRMRWYFQARYGCEEALRTAGLPSYTIFRPPRMTHCYIEPKVRLFYPHLVTERRLVVALEPTTRMAHVNVADVGKAYAAALTRPEDFNRVELGLASENLTTQDSADILAENLGHEFPIHYITAEELDEPRYRRLSNEVDLVANEFGFEIPTEDILRLKSLGLEMGTFADFVRGNKEAFLRSYNLIES